MIVFRQRKNWVSKQRLLRDKTFLSQQFFARWIGYLPNTVIFLLSQARRGFRNISLSLDEPVLAVHVLEETSLGVMEGSQGRGRAAACAAVCCVCLGHPGHEGCAVPRGRDCRLLGLCLSRVLLFSHRLRARTQQLLSHGVSMHHVWLFCEHLVYFSLLDRGRSWSHNLCGF